MKKPFGFAAFALSSVAVMPLAHAQSSVTLYGIVDTGIEYVNHVPGPNGTSGNALRMQSGSLAGSRWGLRGTEDIGGGTNVIFDLEDGFRLTTVRLAKVDVCSVARRTLA